MKEQILNIIERLSDATNDVDDSIFELNLLLDKLESLKGFIGELITDQEGYLKDSPRVDYIRGTIKGKLEAYKLFLELLETPPK